MLKRLSVKVICCFPDFYTWISTFFDSILHVFIFSSLQNFPCPNLRAMTEFLRRFHVFKGIASVVSVADTTWGRKKCICAFNCLYRILDVYELVDNCFWNVCFPILDLNIANNNNITDACILSLRRFNQLRRVTVHSCPEINKDSWTFFSADSGVEVLLVRPPRPARASTSSASSMFDFYSWDPGQLCESRGLSSG